MKGVVAYDSVHGNTKRVAEAIAEEIVSEGHEALLVPLRNGSPAKAEGDFMFIGSPTRMGRMTGNAKAFVEGLDGDFWKERPIAFFDTVGPLSKDEDKRRKWLALIEKSAASRMSDLAKAQGARVHPELLHVAVTGFTGPLAPDALDMAKDFTRKFLASLA